MHIELIVVTTPSLAGASGVSSEPLPFLCTGPSKDEEGMSPLEMCSMLDPGVKVELVSTPEKPKAAQ